MIFPGDESDTLISGDDEIDREGSRLVTFISGGDRRSAPGPAAVGEWWITRSSSPEVVDNPH